MSQSPQISVIMSVRNGQQYLQEAIDSILGQTESDFEFIIVNDGSTDQTAQILASNAANDQRIRLIEQSGCGLTKSLNNALAISQGKFIARMDADDIALPDRFAEQLAYLRSHTECIAVGTGLQMIDPDGDPLGEQIPPTAHENIEQQLLQGCGALPHPTAFIRRAQLVHNGGYDESLRYAQDLDLWLRLAERGKLANLSTPLLKYRLHADAITTDKRHEQLACAQRAVMLAHQRRNMVPADSSVLQTETGNVEVDAEHQWMNMAIQAGEYQTASKYAWKQIRNSPLSLKAWRKWIKLLIKRSRKSKG